MRYAGTGGLLLATMSLGSWAPRSAAQEVAAFGTISGIVVDSLHGGPLANAFIMVEGASRGAATDPAGSFIIDSIPAGSYTAVLFHDLLDALRLAVRTKEIRVAAGDTVSVVLATPSPETVVARRCGSEMEAGDDPAALVGTVFDHSGNPVGGATVILTWRQVTVSRETGVSENPMHRAATSLADGSFQICRLPTDLVADARVATAIDTSGTIVVRMESGVLALGEFTLPGSDVETVVGATFADDEASAAEETAGPVRIGSGIVRGVVTGRDGRPVARARVWINGAAGGAFTDTLGGFALSAQPTGTQTLVVRRIGYEPREIPITVRIDAPSELSIEMTDFVPLLPEVVVRATADMALERVGFAERARVGSGFYVRPEEIATRAASRVTDFLEGAPMLRVAGTGSGRYVTGRQDGTGAGGCVAYAVDGQRWTGSNPDDYLNPGEVGAIEVYARGQAPALFLGVRNCEVVLIWTRTRLGLR